MKVGKQKEREIIFNKYAGACAYCGTELQKGWQADHLIPKRNFYAYVKSQYQIPDLVKHLTPVDVEHIDNKMPACASCNNYKSSHTLEGFRREIGLIVGRLNQFQPTYRLVKRFGLLEEKPIDVKFYFETL